MGEFEKFLDDLDQNKEENQEQGQEQGGEVAADTEQVNTSQEPQTEEKNLTSEIDKTIDERSTSTEETGHVEGQVQEPQAEKPTELSIDDINRVIGGQYGSVDEIKQRLEQLGEIDKLRESNQEYEKLIEQAVNPREHFASDKLYKLNQIQKQNPDVNQQVVSQLLDLDDIDSMDDEQALILQHVMENPAHARDLGRVKRYIQNQYGLNINVPEDATDEEKQEVEDKVAFNRMKLETEAGKAKKGFKQLVEVDLPESSIDKFKQQIESKRSEGNEKLRGNFKPIANGLVKNMDNIKLTYPDGTAALDYAITDEERGILEKGMLDAAIRMGMNPGSQDDVKRLGSYAESFIKANNFSKILKAHRESIIAEMKNQEYDKHNVPVSGSPNSSGVPQDSGQMTPEDIVKQEIDKK
jgi:hypothetical protein